MGTYLQNAIGQSANYVAPLFAINGRSFARGDPSNSSQANSSLVGSLDWGIKNISFTGYRSELGYTLDIPLSIVPPRAQIVQAIWTMYIKNMLDDPAGPVVKGLNPAGIPPAGIALAPYGLRTIATNSATYGTYNGTTPWNTGASFGPTAGLDYTSSPVATPFMITATVNEAIAAVINVGNGRYPVYFDVATEFQYAIDSAFPLRLIFPSLISPYNYGGMIENRIQFDNPSDALGDRPFEHTYCLARYRPAVSFFGADSSRSFYPIDMARLLDPTMVDENLQFYLGTPEAGTSTGYEKYYGRANRSGSPRRRVVVSCGRADITSVAQGGSISGKTLRSIDVYDNNGTASVAATEGTPSGRLRAFADPADAANKFKAGFTPLGSSTETILTEEGTGNTSHTFIADHILVSGGVRAFKFRAVKWSGTAAVDGDVWTATARADLRPNAYSTSTLGLTYIAPKDTADVNDNTPLTSRRRIAARAFARQLWAASFDVDIGAGVMRTYLPLVDVANIAAGDRCTISNSDGTVTAEVTIDVVYASTHGTYPDHVRLTTQIALYDDNSFLVQGLFLGNLSLPNETTITSGVAGGASSLPLRAAFSTVPTEVVILDSAGSVEPEVRAVVNQVGSNLNITPPLTNGFPTNSLVIGSETTSNEPFWIQGDIPPGQALGAYLGYLRIYEFVPY